MRILETRQPYRMHGPVLPGEQGRLHHRGHIARIRASMQHAEPVNITLQINQSYPDNLPLQSTPPSLLLSLPELPKGLEYRLVGRELVLRDVDANIVVDYVANALPG